MVELRRKIDQLLAQKPNRNTSEYREYKKLISRGYPSEVPKLVKIAALLQIAVRTPNNDDRKLEVKAKSKGRKKYRKKKKRQKEKFVYHGPNDLRSMKYRDFLRSDHWKKTKDRAQELGMYKRCYCCGVNDKPLQLHHTTYKWRGTLVEKEKCRGLVAVCAPCHTKIHQLEAETAMSISNATKFVKNGYKK